MQLVYQYLSMDAVFAMGWMLLHSLWQGGILAIIIAFVLHRTGQRSAHFRYNVLASALVTMLLVSGITFMYYHQKSSAVNLPSTKKELVNTTNTALNVATQQAILPKKETTFDLSIVDPYLPTLTLFWALGACFLIARMLLGLGVIYVLKNHKTRQLDSFWDSKLKEIALALGCTKPLQLLESSLVQSPQVIGYLKPIILMPIGAINQLSVAQVEAILAHELAHIIRNDYIINILQNIIDVIYYFNPAMYWISQQLRDERENACDDIAVAYCGNKLMYAKTLLQLQEMQQNWHPRLAMHFAAPKHHLLNRVKRILQPSSLKTNKMERLSVVALLGLSLCFFAFQKDKTNTLPDTSNVIVTDTFPDGKSDVRYSNDKDKYHLKSDNGKITYLEVNGKVIPSQDYHKYEDVTSEIGSSIAPPPPPPPPPPAPGFPSFPSFPKFPSLPDLPDNASAEAKERLNQMNAEIDARNAEIDARNAELDARNAEIDAWNAEKEAREAEYQARIAENEARIAENEARIAEKNHDDQTKRLTKQLVKDGLIKDEKRFEFEISKKGMKVNGKKVSDELFQQYRKLLNLKGDDMMSIEMDEESSTTSH